MFYPFSFENFSLSFTEYLILLPCLQALLLYFPHCYLTYWVFHFQHHFTSDILYKFYQFILYFSFYFISWVGFFIPSRSLFLLFWTIFMSSLSSNSDCLESFIWKSFQVILIEANSYGINTFWRRYVILCYFYFCAGICVYRASLSIEPLLLSFVFKSPFFFQWTCLCFTKD